jgi:Methyltransferase domain
MGKDTMIPVTDAQGNTIAWSSAGTMGSRKSTFRRILLAAHEGRLISGLVRYSLRELRLRVLDPLRELRLRLLLAQRYFHGRRSLPAIYQIGDFSSSCQTQLLKSSFAGVQSEASSPLPDEVRQIEGMSGQKYRSLINRLVRRISDACYLEIGSWKGSTAAAALYGNKVRALCIDNWSEHGGPRELFFANIKKVLTPNIQFDVIERDFRAIDYNDIGSFNVYLFDGPHEKKDQYDGLMIVQPALANPFILIVDDWNWRQVRLGTFQALLDARCRVEASIEIRTTWNEAIPKLFGRDSDWHNGYFIAVVNKAPTSRRSRVD